MTRRRRWLLAILVIVLIGAAMPIVVVLLPCESRAVVLLNATRWGAQVILQIQTYENGPKYTVWSGTVESRVPPLRVPIAAPGLDGAYWVSVHFPETGRSIPELGIGYTVGFLSEVSFFLIRDEDIIYTLWSERFSGKQSPGLLRSVWGSASRVLPHISCLDG